MANRKTQKKREREASKKALCLSSKLTKIKMEGADTNSDSDQQHRVSGGTSVSSGRTDGE